MTILLTIAITTGILSGVWGWIAITFGLLPWAGFLGCTSYFASPTSGLRGLAESLIINMTGVFGYLMKAAGLWLHAKSATTSSLSEQVQ
ncbi:MULTISPECIES: DUF1097 domain-containing protein [Vibrio]|uniref:DUF1097 domain-containing protein n=1 Tax=Vibrio TaxID=662 RepID=UPI000BFFDB27|nr:MULTISPECIES: DUF1097 domain-containing protein [unclassified Vibrio]PHJ43423.1 hypothetical protein AK965_00265 [Vibrio sp. PID17_43]RIZ55195.1 hypothetical protein AK966_07635 [Vibrio sp. PID23_8]